MTDMYSQSQQYNPPDAKSILEFINPNEEIEKIRLEFEGIQRVTIKKGNSTETTYKRINTPMFTHEYIRSLIKDIRHLVNFTVQVSRSESKRIYQNVGEYLLTLKSSLATHGDDNYISEATWAKIVQIHETLTDDDKNAGFESGWEKFGIKWTYDSPVSFEMLKFGVKDFAEEVDQTIYFKRIIRSLAPFLESSLSKSFSGDRDSIGMLLRSLSEMRTETQTFREQKKGGFAMWGQNKEENRESWQ